jgi:hypothetical protein
MRRVPAMTSVARYCAVSSGGRSVEYGKGFDGFEIAQGYRGAIAAVAVIS